MNEQIEVSNASLKIAKDLFFDIQTMLENDEIAYLDIIHHIAIKLDESWAQGREDAMMLDSLKRIIKEN